MQHLVEGVRKFETEVYPSQKEYYSKLAEGQDPEALFICCSDSRVSPCTLTQTLPGELFVVRNAGNVVPPHGAARGGVGATVEYAVVALKVKHIIVCGHSDCGVMKATLKPESTKDLPAVREWLEMTEATRRTLAENHGHLHGQALLDHAVEHNVLMQIQHLQTHPSVASALFSGHLELHAWTYRLDTGRVMAFSSEKRAFVPLEEVWRETAGHASPVGRSGIFKRPGG